LFIVLISIIGGICVSSKHFLDESTDDAKLSSKHFTGVSTDDIADDKKQTLHPLFDDGIGRLVIKTILNSIHYLGYCEI
jgi:hypothetical protein